MIDGNDAAADGARSKPGMRLLLILLLALATVPLAADSYVQGVAARMMIFALFASSLNLILGYAGLASLGHAAYFGMGAYAVAKGKTYFHQLGQNGWEVPPNMFDPFWRAKLQPFIKDELKDVLMKAGDTQGVQVVSGGGPVEGVVK